MGSPRPAGPGGLSVALFQLPRPGEPSGASLQPTGPGGPPVGPPESSPTEAPAAVRDVHVRDVHAPTPTGVDSV
ncbi:hypothetical protein SALBM135S_07524 [Streptomyces alboniger]